MAWTTSLHSIEGVKVPRDNVSSVPDRDVKMLKCRVAEVRCLDFGAGHRKLPWPSMIDLLSETTPVRTSVSTKAGGDGSHHITST